MSQQTGLDVVLRGLEGYVKALETQALKAADEIAHLLESYAKSNHKWQPRTGATDTSTRGFVVAGKDLIEIVLTAGMDYDVFLELARDGKWAWLWPAVIENEERIRQILVKRLGGGNVNLLSSEDDT